MGNVGLERRGTKRRGAGNAEVRGEAVSTWQLFGCGGNRKKLQGGYVQNMA
jgi:hypothetical protein